MGPSNGLVNWTRLYTAIGRANFVLNNLDKVSGLPGPLKNQYIGEALFTRSLCYFYLIRLWGDVPLVTKAFTSANEEFNLPRTPKKEVFAQIEKDLATALPFLPSNYGANVSETKGRATKWAVLALQTDLFLWLAKVEAGGNPTCKKQ